MSTPLLKTPPSRPGLDIGLDSPVFIVGCPRSGTTLLYHMLVSSGHFVNYRAEVHAFSILGPKFGNLKTHRDRSLFLRHWLPSIYCEKTNLDQNQLHDAILNDCSSTADFLSSMMRLMSEQQGLNRWAECTPAHVFYLNQMHAAFPNARFIHMVRDGRDVALSLARQHWINPLPWDKKRSVSVASLFWQHNVSVGSRDGAAIGDKYREVRFEDLVQQPRETLSQLSDFVGEELDYKHITENPVGSVSKPNSSFGTKDDFSPIGRWHAGMSDEQLASVESLVGQTLIDKGYELSQQHEATTRASLMPAVYKAIWTAKHWARTQTFVGRLSTLELIRIATTSEHDRAATPN